MSVPHTTIIGNLTAHPDVSRTSTEHTKTTLRVAVNRRRFVAERDTWESAPAEFFTVVCWRELGDVVGRSLQKGDRVVVTGRLQQREYEVHVGTGEDAAVQRRSVVEIVADDVGASLRFDAWQKVQVRPVREVAPHPALQTVDVQDGPADAPGVAAEATDEDVAAAA